MLTSRPRYVFPGIGLGTILSQAKHITDNMIYASGAALPDKLTKDELAAAMLYPALDRTREISRYVVLKVIRAAQSDEVDRATDLREMDDKSLEEWIHGKMYDPFKFGV